MTGQRCVPHCVPSRRSVLPGMGANGSMIPDITLCLGIDARTIEQLKISWPTWYANRRAMWNWPWLIFYDRRQLSQQDMLNLAEEMDAPSPTVFVEWPRPLMQPEYESQRERMLSGWVHAPAEYCKTEWFMKLDCDALARPHERWLDGAWFNPLPEQGEKPVVIASAWSYSKGVGWLSRLEEWGDIVLSHRPRLNIPHDPTALRVPHSRWASWCCYVRADFNRRVSEACEETCGPGKLPVPSQDSTLWFYAERAGFPVRKQKMKKLNWSNHPKFEALRTAAQEILNGT